jgi:hypothetical protein
MSSSPPAALALDCETGRASNKLSQSLVGTIAHALSVLLYLARRAELCEGTGAVSCGQHIVAALRVP